MRSTMFILAVTALCAAAPPAAAGTGGDANTPQQARTRASTVLSPRSITVSGDGEVRAAPDAAEVEAGVVTTGPNAREALDENNTRMRAVLDGLHAAGIQPVDIQTRGLQVGPLYARRPQDGEPPAIRGYRVSNTVHVTVRELPRLGPVLDGLVAHGANQVEGIRFVLSDPSAALDRARRAAVADARHRARLYAEAAGVALGPVLTIEEQSGGGAPVPRMRALAMGAAAVPVAAGELRFQAGVRVRFAIR